MIAIPTWKIFTFGGVIGPLSDQDRQGKLSNATSILDTGVNRWTTPKTDGKAPPMRSDASMAYDTKNSRLIVFGGWADEWLADLYTLDVGNIVGPPYAITDMIPRMGPVTGGTDINIFGIDFVNTVNVVVRFGNHRNAVDVPGVFVSQTKIKCVSPNSSKLALIAGSGEVDVRVSLNGDSFTTTSQKFTFFPVTNGSNCIMYGPGLLSGCAIKEQVSFMIQARDDYGNNRTTGGDGFNVLITMLGGGEDGENVRVPGVILDDYNNGRYLATYVAKYSGKYEIKVDFLGTYGGKAGPLRGSGKVIEFSEKAPRENNQMSGDLVINALRADIVHLQKFTEDLAKTLLVKLKDDSWSTDEQIQVLMKIKESLLIIEANNVETSLMVDRSECVLKYLLEESIVIGGLEDALLASKSLWEKLVRESPQIQAKIAPMMRSHTSKIKQDIFKYETHITNYKDELTKGEYQLYVTGMKKSLELLAAAELRMKEEQIACDKMAHIAHVFDVMKEMETSNKLMIYIKDLLADYKLLWESIAKVIQTIDEAKALRWSNLNSEALEDSSKTLAQLVRKMPKSIRQTDAFIGMDKTVKDFVIVCPIIASLQSPAMRERHWQELMAVVKKTFEIPSKSPKMTLDVLINLQLHKSANEVDEITEKASKEAKHEDTLKNLENTWSTVNFAMNFYKDSDVPLLKFEDDAVEQLESDQMAVQSIVGSRYGHFKTEASSWQVTLGLVSDISQSLQEIQRTWSYLEPLFIGSDEVRKELPDDAKRFEEVDRDVKAILQKAWKIRNVKNVCSQPGLLDKLNGLEKQQEQCKKSLSDFLDGKRRQFPRFYFMSEADLLDLLSNSSQPARVLMQVI